MRTVNRHRPPAHRAGLALGAAEFLAVAAAAATWTFLIGRLLGFGV